MRVLFLGPRDSCVYRHLCLVDDTHIVREKLAPGGSLFGWAEYIVSHRYTHYIPKEVLDLYPRRAINIHAGLLPEVRGVHPVFWSVLEGIPLGFTIHYMSEKIDHGPILHEWSQSLIRRTGTFRLVYEKITDEISWLFQREWQAIKCGRCDKDAYWPSYKGRYFSKKLFEEVEPVVLTEGWGTSFPDAQRRYNAFKARNPERFESAS